MLGPLTKYKNASPVLHFKQTNSAHSKMWNKMTASIIKLNQNKIIIFNLLFSLFF